MQSFGILLVVFPLYRKFKMSPLAKHWNIYGKSVPIRVILSLTEPIKKVLNLKSASLGAVPTKWYFMYLMYVTKQILLFTPFMHIQNPWKIRRSE